MTKRKERVTVTVDADLVAAGNRAVKHGRADSLSGWINEALVEREAKEKRLEAMREAVAAYEAEFGKISTAEMVAQRRADDSGAVLVRGARRQETHSSARRSRNG
jgi:hypothetical protein